MPPARDTPRPIAPKAGPRRFVFVLLDNFTLISLASALECLRIANRIYGEHFYNWRIIGEGGDSIACSAGTVFKLDGDLEELQREDTVLVCGGIDIRSATSTSTSSFASASRSSAATCAAA